MIVLFLMCKGQISFVMQGDYLFSYASVTLIETLVIPFLCEVMSFNTRQLLQQWQQSARMVGSPQGSYW